MYGVVLWSDARSNKAVFWCEDHGDLAYFQGDPATVNQMTSCFDAGDLVQFEVYHEAKLRKALNPKVVRSKADADLPNKLLRHSAGITRKQTGGEVLPFRPKSAIAVRLSPAGAGQTSTCHLSVSVAARQGSHTRPCH